MRSGTPPKKAKAWLCASNPSTYTSTLGFPGIGHDEHLSAEGQAEMREFDGLHDTAEFDLLLAPNPRPGCKRPARRHSGWRAPCELRLNSRSLPVKMVSTTALRLS